MMTNGDNSDDVTNVNGNNGDDDTDCDNTIIGSNYYDQVVGVIKTPV